MKAPNILASAIIAMSLVSCSSEENLSSNPAENLVEINLHTTYLTEEEPMYAPTRALTAEKTKTTRISLKVFDDNDVVVYEGSQRTGDENFGAFTDIRLSPGTYTFVAVGHQATSAEAEDAVIESPQVVSISDSYPLEIYACTKDVTVTSGDFQRQDVTLSLKLCITKLRFLLNDEIPQDVKEIETTVNNGFPVFTALTFNPATGLFSGNYSFTRRWIIPEDKYKDGLTFSTYALLSEYPLSLSASIVAYDNNGNVYSSREFTDVTLKRGVMTTIKTYLFTNNNDVTLEFEEWGQEEVLEKP